MNKPREKKVANHKSAKNRKKQKERSPDSIDDAYSPQRLPDELRNDQEYLQRISASGGYSASSHKLGIVGQVPGQQQEGADSQYQDDLDTINIQIRRSAAGSRQQPGAGRGGNTGGYQKTGPDLTSASLSRYQSERARDSKTGAAQRYATGAGGRGPPSGSASNSQFGGGSQSDNPSAKGTSQLDSVNQGRSKYESTALNQLTANILEVMAQGEKSCEIIRKVLFETAGFHAFDLFSELRTYGPAKQREVQKKKQLAKLQEQIENGENPELARQQMENLNADLEITSGDNKKNDQQNGQDEGGADFDGIDDRCLHCFLQVGLQGGVLKSDINEKDCIFLVNVIAQDKLKAIPYESLIDFIIPQTNKKVSTRLLRKVKRKDLHEIKKCPYEIMCIFAKLIEVEITIKRKIQRQIQRFHARIVGTDQGKGDLQIAELFSTMDAKNEGKVHKGQVKGLMASYGTRNMVPNEDIKALCRRLDHDQDGEISFSDFFGAMLPYFIYGSLKSLNQKNPMALASEKPISLRKKLQILSLKGKNPTMPQEKIQQRSKSAKLGRPTFSKGFFKQHQDLLVFEEGKKYDFQEKDPQGFVCIRNREMAGQEAGGSQLSEYKSASAQERKSSKPISKKLFSQNQPELMFYRKPALSSTKGLIRKNPDLQRPHVPYLEPLMKFFHDSIDFERRMETNKQELILQDDYSIFQVFNALTGNEHQNNLNLALLDLQTSLSKFFNVMFSYKEIKLALIRQYPISAAGRVEQLRYSDFEDLMKPKSKEFKSYVQRKLKMQKEADVGGPNLNQQTELGVTALTHMKLGQLFEDLLRLENQLEMHRKYKLSQINIRDCFRCIDKFKRGYITLEDYYNFFEEYYCEDLPVSTEEIDYLFKRHNKEKMGRVTEATFLKELMPLDDYIIIE